MKFHQLYTFSFLNFFDHFKGPIGPPGSISNMLYNITQSIPEAQGRRGEKGEPGLKGTKGDTGRLV